MDSASSNTLNNVRRIIQDVRQSYAEVEYMFGPVAFPSWTQATEHFGNAWSEDAMRKRVRERG
ncbi:hypothetical protein Ciccas_000860 [Cichlidogyrus casuarinus]|uniref:Uncharacterized protein n=1 Tax=Cichlidogyrus casuarinus TaxID=1844966 RepID=A0ABD2QLQ3_9PLAT